MQVVYGKYMAGWSSEKGGQSLIRGISLSEPRRGDGISKKPGETKPFPMQVSI